MLFSAVGLFCLFFTLKFVTIGQIASASAAFAMAFFSFFYSNLSRFKKFKGLGFEAELWEEKQKEAEDLIGKLKNIVFIYTREVMMGNIMRGRWGGDNNWAKHWALFDELRHQHAELQQDLDFSSLKNQIDSVFIFDLCSPIGSYVRTSIERAKAEAGQKISEKFGSPVVDIAGHSAAYSVLNDIEASISDLFERSQTDNIAELITEIAKNAKIRLEISFDIVLNFNELAMQRLQDISLKIESRPLLITDEILGWADDRMSFD